MVKGVQLVGYMGTDMFSFIFNRKIYTDVCFKLNIFALVL